MHVFLADAPHEVEDSAPILKFIQDTAKGISPASIIARTFHSCSSEDIKKGLLIDLVSTGRFATGRCENGRIFSGMLIDAELAVRGRPDPHRFKLIVGPFEVRPVLTKGEALPSDLPLVYQAN